MDGQFIPTVHHILACIVEKLRGILRQVWGFESFRPLQAEAMRSVVEGRDSVVVLPTGGGKSLCFQAPALVMDGVAVVLSPLISRGVRSC